MKKNILKFAVIGITGALAHFLYEWSGKNAVVGIFSAVNESTWEHLKLLFFPAVIYSLIELAFLKEKPKNFFPALFLGVSCGMLLITTLFYTYSGVLGYSVDFINILIYYIGVAAFIIKFNKIIREKTFNKKSAVTAAVILLIITALLFAVFTFSPLSLGIFTPPIV